jgi:hypothetical protein
MSEIPFFTIRKERDPFFRIIQKGSRPFYNQKGEIPSCIRVNLRPSAVKKERDPFLTQIQKSDRYLE